MCRDLANVLNVKNMQSASKQITWAEIGNPKNAELIKIPKEAGKYAALTTRSLDSKHRFVHLCEFGVDCSKSLPSF
jgi:hypothetical protein